MNKGVTVRDKGARDRSARGPGGRGVAGNFHGEESPGSTK